jgi:hypothetical protein
MMCVVNCCASWKAGGREPHGNPQGFGFLRAGNHTAVIVGEHDHGFTLERGIKDALTGDVKIVAVDQANVGSHGRCLPECVAYCGFTA